MTAEDFPRSPSQLEAEAGHPDWSLARSHLRVHIVADMAVDEAIGRVGKPTARALAAVRTQQPDLPFGLAFEAFDRAVGLSFGPEDDGAEIVSAVDHLPAFDSRVTLLGWERKLGTWIAL